jgi:hypothetical protein
MVLVFWLRFLPARHLPADVGRPASTCSANTRSWSLAKQEDPLYIYNESELRAHVRSQVSQLANASAHTRCRRHITCTCAFAHWHGKYTRAVICEGSAVKNPRATKFTQLKSPGQEKVGGGISQRSFALTLDLLIHIIQTLAGTNHLN